MSVIDNDEQGRRDVDERQHNNQQCRSEWLDRMRQKQRRRDMMLEVGGNAEVAWLGRNCRSDDALATMETGTINTTMNYTM